MDITKHHELPYEISLSFDLLLKHYQDRLLVEKNKLVKEHLEGLIATFEQYPLLS